MSRPPSKIARASTTITERTRKTSQRLAASSKNAKKSKITEETVYDDNGGIDTVFHKCIICSVGFRQRKPKIRYQKLSTSSKVFDDEFGIFFCLNECLGIPAENTEVIFSGLVDAVGEPDHWGVSFCSKHSDVVKQVNEISELLTTLASRMKELKKGMKTDAVDSFESDADLDGEERCKGYKGIRFALKTALLPQAYVKEVEEELSTPTINLTKSAINEDDEWDITEVKVENEEEMLFTEPEIQFGDYLENTESNYEDEVDLPSDDNNSMDYRVRRKSSRKPKSLKSLKKRAGKKLLAKAKGAREREKVFKCAYCPILFRDQDERNAHRISNHEPDEKKPFECNICGKGYLYANTLNAHQVKAHGTERPFPCNQCPKSYAFGVDLRKHQKLAHSAMANETVNCPTCGKEYKGQFNLRKHIRQLHRSTPMPKKTFVCEVCAKTYRSIQAFQIHQAKEHLQTHQRSICDECGKQFSDPKSLRKHKLSQHLKTFKYTCEICGSKSLFKSHFAAHMKSAHGSGSETGTGRKKNKSNEDPNAQQLLDSYPFECFSCGEEFSSRSQLQTHKSSCAQFAFL